MADMGMIDEIQVGEDIYHFSNELVTSALPIGMIMPFMGVTAPMNWLACDGTVYNIADYSDLANFFENQFGTKNHFGGDGTTTFAVPDLRGEFLRGTGTNGHTNQGSGDAVGVHQDATEHMNFSAYQLDDGGHLVMHTTSNGVYPANIDSEYESGTLQSNSAVPAWKGASTSKTKITSRPANTSVLWCILAK